MIDFHEPLRPTRHPRLDMLGFCLFERDRILDMERTDLRSFDLGDASTAPQTHIVYHFHRITAAIVAVFYGAN